MSKKRMIALGLAIAMVFSSLPTGLGTETKTAKAAETTNPSANKLFQWDEESGYVYSSDGYYATYTRNFEAPSVNIYTLYCPEHRINEDKVMKLLRGMYTLPADAACEDYDVEYAWMEVDENGDVIEDLPSNWYGANIDREFTNEDPDKKWYYRCIVSVDSIELNNGDVYYIDDISDYVTESDYSLQCDFTIQYTGPTKEKLESGEIKLSDYIDGLDTVKDQRYVYANEEQENAESMNYINNAFSTSNVLSLEDVEVKWDYDDYVQIASRWYAYSVDGDKEEITSLAVTGTSITAASAKVQREFTQYDEAGNVSGPAIEKVVDYYECEFIVYHGDTALADYVVKYDLEQSPIKYNPSEAVEEVVVALNGTATLTMRTEIYDEEYCTGVMYQWYKIAKDGTETKLKGQNTKSLKVRVKDYDTKYKCRIQAKFSEGYDGVPYSAYGTFQMIPDAGYKLKMISDEYVYLCMGESKTLSVKAKVNDGYTVSYRWLEGKSFDSKEDYKEVGTQDSYTVSANCQEDYTKRYYLDVTVYRGEEIIEEYSYYYMLKEDYYLNRTDNDGTIYSTLGEDVKLYADYEVTEKVSVIKRWYICFEESTYYTTQYDDEVGENVDVFEGGYVPPEEEEYDIRYSHSESVGGYWKRYYRYYKAINPEENSDEEDIDAQDSDVQDTESIDPSEDSRYIIDKDGNLLIKGRDIEGNLLDNAGEYICIPYYYIEEESAEEPREIQGDRLRYTIQYDTNLYVRAKASNVQAPAGTKATLQVIANNDNQDVYPISYTWEKLDATIGTYVTLTDEEGEAIDTASYEIESVENTDYGTYRVTVSDFMESKEILITLSEKKLDYIIYTPELSIYHKNFGETVTFQVDTDIEDEVEIYYEWQKYEKVYEGNDIYYDAEWVYSELLGKEGKTCSVTLNDAEDFTEYRCILTFKTTDGNGNPILTSEEVYFEVEPAGEFSIVPMSRVTEYKKVGSSRTYSVKPVTDIANMDNTKIKYRWYVNDKEVENVTGTVYSVASLKKEDFGSVEVEASYVDENGLQYSDSYTFSTYIHTEFGVTNNNTTKYVMLGSDVTLAPEFSEETDDTITYQWSYNYKISNYSSVWVKLAGATSKEYQIPDVSVEDLRKYSCTIWVNGVQAETYTVTLAEDTSTASIELSYAEGTSRYMDVRYGEDVTIGVVAKSDKDLDLKYQWYKGYWSDDAIGGATKDTLTITNLTPDEMDDYICVVKDSQGNTNSIRVKLQFTSGLAIDTGAWGSNYYLGYETTLGGNATLVANASIDEGNEIFYQWRRKLPGSDTWKAIYGQNASTLTLNNITEDMLGSYSCEVTDAYGTEVYVYYNLHIDTGLITVADAENVLAEADGSVKMSVTSRADAGYTISYQWAKKQLIKEGDPSYDVSLDTNGKGQYEIYVDIPNATSATYGLTKITKADYGSYRVTVSTRGEAHEYFFYLNPEYKNPDSDKDWAQEGEDLTVNMEIVNAAVDENYQYEWWVTETVTNNKRRVDCTTATFATKAPKLVQNKLYNGYCNITYLCISSAVERNYNFQDKMSECFEPISSLV